MIERIMYREFSNWQELTIVVPFINQDHESGQWDLLFRNLNNAHEVDIVAFANGADELSISNVSNYLCSLTNSEIYFSNVNLGVTKAFNHVLNKCDTEFICMLHDDMYLFEKNWDKRMISRFVDNKDLSMLGVYGSNTIYPNGTWERGWSNLVDAEKHGYRSAGWGFSTFVDGCLLMCRTSDLKAIGGMYEDYPVGIMYERDLSLSLLNKGKKVGWDGISCWHNGGMTSQRQGMYKDFGDKTFRELEMEAYNMWYEKWKDKLPCILK